MAIDLYTGGLPSRRLPVNFSINFDDFADYVVNSFVAQANALAEDINNDANLAGYRDAAIAAKTAAEAARDQAVAIVGGQFLSYGAVQSLSGSQRAQARQNLGMMNPIIAALIFGD